MMPYSMVILLKLDTVHKTSEQKDGWLILQSCGQRAKLAKLVAIGNLDGPDVNHQLVGYKSPNIHFYEQKVTFNMITKHRSVRMAQSFRGFHPNARSRARRPRPSACNAKHATNADIGDDARVRISRAAMLRSSLLATVTTAWGTASVANADASTHLNLVSAGVIDSKPFSKVVLKTLSDCQLAVSKYPTFAYNASGGGGVGRIVEDNGDVLVVCWDADSLRIPSIRSETSSVLGIPIPPPLTISIVPKTLRGTINKVTGQTDLEFLATFEFTAGSLYKASPLLVQTNLTSETSSGELFSRQGQRLSANGHVELVGVAKVPKTEDDTFLDTFLMLPTDALAILSAEIKFLP